jgi:hypothetical protein
MAGERISGGPGGPTPCHGVAWPAPPCGVVAWWVRLGHPRCHSAPFQMKFFLNNFLELFEKLYF